MVDEIRDGPEYCTICGRPLGYSVDDQPNWPTGPMCGDCYQARQADDEVFWSAEDDTDSEDNADHA